ncbi:hypothetical protein GCM10027275_46560 [Rhabdobacter roseus]|uniref:Mannose-1-phosphate guanylyltransferase n=1 Tax=Rhabdobacter roseus TaxID=1655419 RepID=A0A840TUU5_9BACT|nr:sugar phosphate nucleotidyltransferase [Rhabdobacter roseus]MBB5286675.1 mannose-1-phosphate guanylyltransferase [Rhabdobacter roseus]
MLVNVILSGGVGSRLWPVSRKSQPKQYLPLFGGQSLFQLTVERNRNVADHTLVVGSKDNYLLSRADLARVGKPSYTDIVEAAPRNTAAAIAFAALAVAPDDLLLVTPSDHIITNTAAYEQAVRQAAQLAEQGYLVTFGLVPSRPETGYGYLECDGNEVRAFREKPDAATALLFCESGRFLWNSGMFCFRAGTYLNELQRHEPTIYEASHHAWEARTDSFLPEAETARIPSQSIDYAVMERCDKIKVVPADLGWSDLGSFESLWEYLHAQGQQHHFVQNNLVIGATRHVEFLGLDDIILVETPDAILVMAKNSAQDVKKIYERLEKEKPELVQ